MPDITVIGAGVIGLTTALALQRAGHTVRVVASAKGADTTSWVAGAVWYPYRVGPKSRAVGWAGATADWLIKLAAEDPSAGVDLLTRYELADDQTPPWWLPAARNAKLVHSDFPGSHLARYAWSFTAPRADPTFFLSWLEAQLPPIEIRRVESLADEPGDLVVNCTGLRGRHLTGDTELQAIFGQVILVEPGQTDPLVCPGDERDPNAIFYAIPRRRGVIIGGCAFECPDDQPAVPREDLTRQMLDRARRLGVHPGPVIRAAAGLRPFRREVRLERDPVNRRILHNYGHGGAGYTLSWGCAQEVVTLVARG